MFLMFNSEINSFENCSVFAFYLLLFALYRFLYLLLSFGYGVTDIFMSAFQMEHGGLPTSPPRLMIPMFHGENFVLHSVHITYLRICSAAS
jgi:hypothetical protein